jgi:hypothetical protein
MSCRLTRCCFEVVETALLGCLALLMIGVTQLLLYHLDLDQLRKIYPESDSDGGWDEAYPGHRAALISRFLLS